MNYFNDNSNKNFLKANDQKKIAIRKFAYELKLHKKEFLNECAKYDFDFSSRIKRIHFEAILNKFTCYLSNQEKDYILANFVINDAYVNYIELSNIKCVEDYIYMDPLLNHLNILKNEHDLRNISLSIKRISKVVEVQPLNLLNFQISEENFLIHLAKQIMEYILANSNKLSPDDYFMQLAVKYDFDFDGNFTIGELNNFLLCIKLHLEEYDLRFFFESFESEEGKFPIEKLKDYVLNESKKNFGIFIDTSFMHNKKEIFTEEKLKEESRIEKIISTNYFLQIIRESLKNCGKSFLLKYFAKYIEVKENNFYIDSVWLEVGYKKLGYKEISLEDIGNFKYFCVKKSLGFLNNQMTLNLKIEMLFDFLIKEFNLHVGKKIIESNTIINEISSKILDDLTENILSYGIEKKEKEKFSSHVDEYEFRRKFVSSFDSIDHNFVDYIIKMLKIKNEIGEDFKNKTFSVELIESRSWLHLMLNLMFMGLIKHSDEFGLMLDEYDKVQLNGIYVNLENRIFPKESIAEKSLKIVNINATNYVVTEDKNYLVKEKFDLEKMKIEENFKIIKNLEKVNAFKSKNYSMENKIDAIDNFSKVNLIKIKSNNTITRINENFDRISNFTSNYSNGIKSYKDKINVNVSDTANLVPELFEFCAKYIKEKYKLEIITAGLITKMGCCQIFRDHFTMNKVDSKNEMNFHIFIKNLKNTPNLSESLFQFLELLGSKYKNKNEFINPLYFFTKIEEILIQFSKLNPTV